MIQQQLAQIVFWLGVIVCIPTFYRFVYAGSALLWRQIFPTKTIEVRLYNHEHILEKTITIQLDKKNSKKIIDLIEEASIKERRVKR
ncbi:hypothetical protein ACIU3Q_005854 [Salmonella enterica subsp. enterica serovar Kokomlemle]